jgi:hypothetical protein
MLWVLLVPPVGQVGLVLLEHEAHVLDELLCLLVDIPSVLFTYERIMPKCRGMRTSISLAGSRTRLW